MRMLDKNLIAKSIREASEKARSDTDTKDRGWWGGWGVLREGDGAEMDLLFTLSLPPRLSNIITWPWIQLSYNVTMPHPTLARKKVTTNILIGSF